MQSNVSYAAEQRELYDADLPSAYDLTAGTGNLMIQLPLSNWTSDSSSIIRSAQAQWSSALLGGNPDSSVLRGFTKQRRVILETLNTAVVGGISWNTGPETSIYMTRPFSRGSVKLKSTSVLDAPLIDYGALKDSTDLEILYAIYMKNRELMSAQDISLLGPIETAPAPGIRNKKAIKEAILKNLAPSNAHQFCTSSIIIREDCCVVDPQNKLYCTSILSLVYASIWPLFVSGGPQATVYAAAEKAAYLIKARYELR